MDIVSRLNRRNHDVTVRARRMNKSACRLLDEKIHKMAADLKRQTRLLERETESIHSDLHKMAETPRGRRAGHTDDEEVTWDDDFTLPSFREKVEPDVEETKPEVKISSRSPTADCQCETPTQTKKHLKLKTSKSVPRTSESNHVCNSNANIRSTENDNVTDGAPSAGFNCRYNLQRKNSKCPHFPCRLPETYHSLGFRIGETDYRTLSNYEELTSRTNQSPTAKPTCNVQHCGVSMATSDSVKTPRLSVKDRIRGLNIYIQEMKAKNELKKPRDWAVRYGEPIPRRLLLKTVVPVS